MLKARNLDDQTFEEIVQAAEGRLPWLCPVWTDHNAHDPGITILELMAWYKEMQQYQMDQLTPAIQQKLLALAGLVFLVSLPCLGGFAVYGTDLHYHMDRVANIAAGLRGGQFPVFIYPDFMNGYGYASPVFYGEALLYLPAGCFIIPLLSN